MMHGPINIRLYILSLLLFGIYNFSFVTEMQKKNNNNMGRVNL